jgi:hypothetical protein
LVAALVDLEHQLQQHQDQQIPVAVAVAQQVTALETLEHREVVDRVS